jgi:lysophospholipase L1-like esterase
VAAILRLAAVVVALAVAACSSGVGELPKLLPGDVILAFGDSLTFGTGAGREESYPSLLAQRIGIQVINGGVPGEVTEKGRERLPKVLARVRPKLVILCLGGNDMLRRQDPRQTEENLKQMVRLIRDQGAAVVMLGVPEPGFFLSTADVYERVASEFGVPLEDDIIPDLLGDNRYKSDHVHPNAAGYARLAEAVEALLRNYGAL